jgi:hypothetical protein
VCDLVVVDRLTGSVKHGTNVRCQLSDPDPVRANGGIKGGAGVSVDVAVLPVSESVDRVCDLLRHTCGTVLAIYEFAG